MTATALLVVAGYLVGAVPTGLVFGKLAGVDPRRVGSGRVGATNTYRALGLPASIAVAVIDALKGGVMAYLGLRYAASDWGLAAVVLATVLGQVYSIFLLAQGGRGVATTRDLVQHRRLDLQEAPGIEERPDRGDDPGAGDEGVSYLLVHDQVDVALAVAGLDVLQPMPLLGQRSQGLAQQLEALHPDARLSTPCPLHLS